MLGLGRDRAAAPERTVQLIGHIPAQSKREEALHAVYTAAVWRLRGPSLARAFMDHLLMPEVLAVQIGGIPRVFNMSLHWDAGRKEWYLCTEGSNFVGLYTTGNGLAIDRRRCFTTNVLEILSTLGLEAVCAMFTNGDLSRSRTGRGVSLRSTNPRPGASG